MIVNKTAKITLAPTQVTCSSFISKAFGLMFRKKPDYGMIFSFTSERRVALTMWFVFFPIDVIWLDKNKRVVEIKRNFKPFTNYTPANKAMHVIEFQTGRIGKTKIGDLIHWQ